MPMFDLHRLHAFQPGLGQNCCR